MTGKKHRPSGLFVLLLLHLIVTTLAATQVRAEAPSPGFVGSQACASCHETEAAAWKGSHHAHAMALATPATVRGDFNAARAENHGSKAAFLREGDRYIVETEGKDGKTARFTISHTFGVEPLQQYLVRFDDGRIQALPWAWDTRPKDSGGQRWFHLYPNQAVPAADPLHWTRGMQNWNFMCAECHVTGLVKNYDAATDRFDTRFAEAGVGCESCHGPGAGHIDWTKTRDDKLAHKGFASAHAKRAPVTFAPDPATGSPKQSAPHAAGDEVELCAHCHARRGQIAEGWRPGAPLAETHAPALIEVGLFEDDGQMKDEVFNDQSFKQSLMYAKGVVCSDCHDPHSGKLKAARSEVCGQCHEKQRFTATAHTGHKSASAPDCVSCHMPTRTYMVVDARHDHSFRIPRPDLSVAFGAPNACNDCHKDKQASWAAEAVEQWHGKTRKGFQTWTEALHRARRGEPAARALLLDLASKPQTPAIIRATAINEAQRFPSRAVGEATEKALHDSDPVVRMAALRSLSAAMPVDQRWRLASPLLNDAVRVVRIEAANALADQPLDGLSSEDAAKLKAAFAEYEVSQRLDADRPEGRANLAHFYLRQGKLAEAEAEYRAGLKLEQAAAPLAVDLADLYRAQGKEDEAEQTLRAALVASPDSGAAHHALGLGLIRQKRYDEALPELARAVELAPDEARFAHVHVVALMSLERMPDARTALDAALRRFPYESQLLRLELQNALEAQDVDRAAPLVHTLSELTPDDEAIRKLDKQLGGR